MIPFGLLKYLLAGSVAFSLGASGYGYIQKQRADSLRLKLDMERSRLATCGARLQNILEDIRSDAEIDDLPDSALTVVPDHWLRPEGDETSN